MNNNNGRGNIFPWQVSAWQLLWEAKQKHRLPHAILMLGASDGEKERFAHAFAHSILCSSTSEEGYTCGECHTCHLLKAQSHPDVLNIIAEPPTQIIKIDQIREVVHFVNETSMQGSFKIIIIHHAHQMNHNASNALLKTLEEPAPRTLFILLSTAGKRLQTTITSRCQKFILHPPDDRMALQWLQLQLPPAHSYTIDRQEIALKLAEGAPLKALSLLTDQTMMFRQNVYQGLVALSQEQSDPLQLAAQCHEHDIQIFFHLLFYWLQDLLKLHLTAGTANIVNSDYRDVLITLTSRIVKEKILSYLTDVQNRYLKICHSLNLNRQLLLEELFIRWAALTKHPIIP